MDSDGIDNEENLEPIQPLTMEEAKQIAKEYAEEVRNSGQPSMHEQLLSKFVELVEVVKANMGEDAAWTEINNRVCRSVERTISEEIMSSLSALFASITVSGSMIQLLANLDEAAINDTSRIRGDRRLLDRIAFAHSVQAVQLIDAMRITAESLAASVAATQIWPSNGDPFVRSFLSSFEDEIYQLSMEYTNLMTSHLHNIEEDEMIERNERLAEDPNS